MKLKRGQKLCNHCNNVNGARAKVCKHCNKQFEVRTDLKTKINRKRNRLLVEVKNWQDLKPRQTIYFKGRSGNYYLNHDGTKEYNTPKGVYKIDKVLQEGLGVFGNRGYTFIYMGKERKSTWGGNSYYSPHKIYIKNEKTS